MKNSFDTKIKEFQCDGAYEIVKESFKDFLDSNGISMIISCHIIHQQNVVAERKVRQIIEVGNTLSFNASMPKRFWFDAFLTAIYLINRIPTKLLQLKRPYEVLFNKLLDYIFLKVFGCICFPHLAYSRQDKLINLLCFSRLYPIS